MQKPMMTVVGAGRIGLALLTQSHAAHWPCTQITRTEGWDTLAAPAGTPIVLCVRNDDLQTVVPRVPDHRLADLVVVQNGMVRPWLRAHGLDAVTRGLILFAVARPGDRPQPGGASLFWGRHAELVATWLATIGLPAQSVDAPTFARAELEKLLWNTTMGAICQVQRCTVGQAVTVHAAQFVALLAELAPLGAAALGLAWSQADIAPCAAKLTAYSLTIADYRAAIKESAWRNGWFADQARSTGAATPCHNALLAAATGN